MKNISVIGAGSWGTTIAQLIALNGNKVKLYTKDKKQMKVINEEHINKKYLPGFTLSENIIAFSNFKDVVKDSDIIFVVVPSSQFRVVIKECRDWFTPQQIVITASKGIENNSYKVMSDILAEETSIKLIGALSGPNLAKEIMKGYPAATIVASKFNYVVDSVNKIMRSDKFKVFGSKDLVGVELSGALKNVIAIASGIANQIGFGINASSFLVTQGAKEINQLTIKLGGDNTTFSGLAGVGDLMATAFSDLSRNFRFGKLLAEGKSAKEAIEEIGQVVEGYYTTKTAYEYSLKMKIDMPIIKSVYQILYENIDIENSLKELLNLPLIWE